MKGHPQRRYFKFLFSERSLNELFMLIMLNATAPV